MEVQDALKSSDPHVRFQALKDCCRKKPQPACKTEIVRICQADRYGYNRLQAVLALKAYWPEPDVVKVVSARLTDEQYIAEAAIRVMGEVKDDKAYEHLQRAFFTTRNVWVKLNVLTRMSFAPQDVLFAFLKRSKVLESPDEKLRAAAVSMLGRVRNPTLKPLFLQRLKDKNDRVRANALEALASVCDREELAKVLASYVRDRNNRVRANAVLLLLQMGFQKADAFLREMVTSASGLFRASAAYVLGRVRDSKQHRQWLRALLSDSDEMVQAQAELSAERLRLMGGSSSAAAVGGL